MLTPATPPTLVPDGLRSTLEHLVRPGADPNPAFDALLADYARYHLVLAIVGAAFLVLSVSFAWFAWRRFRHVQAVDGRRWTIAKVTYLVATLGSLAVGLVLLVIVVANASTALDPRPGFAGAVGLVGTPRPGTPRAELHQAFDEWLRSGHAALPPVVRAAVDDRLAWQRPKAVVSAVLLVVVSALGAWVWRPLVGPDRRAARRWWPGDVVRLGVGLSAVAVGLVLMLMVMGNTQAAIAPVAMTLFYG